LILFNFNFAVGYLQLSVGKLHLPAPNFCNRQRRCGQRLDRSITVSYLSGNSNRLVA